MGYIWGKSKVPITDIYPINLREWGLYGCWQTYKMKIKESFAVSATVIFALCWMIFYVLINAAQGVGDAPNSVNPYLRATWISLVVVFAYSIRLPIKLKIILKAT
jgi:hypothetical protein